MPEHWIPTIAFVWRPEEMTQAVTEMAHRTGSRAIFDFSMTTVEALSSALRTAGSAGPVRDIKISASALMDRSLLQLLTETGIENLWVECHPSFFRGDSAAFLQRLRELPQICRCFPILGDVQFLATILNANYGIGRIVLKGCEASGFVSGETTLTLYSAIKELLRHASPAIDILIWGGISTPEAAAALLSTGAKGIVFESVHWLTDLVAVGDDQRRRIANLRLDSTELVGLDLQVPCRLFNKGNSIAVKELRRSEISLPEGEITGENRRLFADRVRVGAIHPLLSHFIPGDIIPLGVESAFAASFAERFGIGTEAAVKSFLTEICRLCRLAEGKKKCFLDSPVAAEMGTRYPFIQGAMSWITDLPEFALKVAEAGGLPTIALGMMDGKTLDLRLGHMPEVMGRRPYAVNIISLAENPCRDSQLTWIKKHRPRFVVIAGGDLSPSKELLECGIEVIYIAPDEALLRLAVEAGVRFVICEGYEAGGHVGRHSTLTLAQRVMDMKRLQPSLLQNCRIVLAGGICNRENAFIAAMLGADAIQMGTAYLATREIVETGALTPLYQRMILESPPGGTVVSGQDTGLRVRSLKTLRTAAVLALEREFAASRRDEHSFRRQIEEMTAGSLFAAARGMDPGGVPLDERACLERGQFMSGACAGLLGTVMQLQDFHRQLAEGTLLLHRLFAGSIDKTPEIPLTGIGHGRQRVAPVRDDGARIAITGMSIVNALGQSPEEVWAKSLAMQSGITLVPPSRWDHALFYDPRPQIPDKTYCRVGAFLNFPVSRQELGIPPHDFRTMTEATKITMWLADKAILASGILDSGIPPERIGVLISQNSGEAAGTLTNTIIRAYVHDIVGSIKKAVHLSPEQQSAIEREVRAGRMAPDDTTLLGRLNCAAAGFICNRYGFMGPSYAVSAACATSLVALYSAIQMIKNGIIDAAIVGGGEDNLTHLHFLEFSALGALYGLSGQERPARHTSRPFDGERDGMVLGEGGGMIVIEREGPARARGARVHAVITGMGASNNPLGMVEASSVAQEIAIRASFQETEYGPETVDLVECHATSTRQGDVEEIRALKTFFNSANRTVLSSFKSQIGHTLGASGINSLIRGVMAMQAGIFPPTLNYLHPDPAMDLKGSGLLIAPEPLDWTGTAGRLRRLQVNAFGFGGSNYVVQVEQAMDERATVLVLPDSGSGLSRAQAEPAAGLPEEPDSAGKANGGPPAPEFQGVSCFRARMDGRDYRMAVVAESRDEARTAIDKSSHLLEGGSVTARIQRALAQQGVFIGPADLPALPLALVFPGQGTHYEGMGRELYESFPVIREEMDRAAAVAEFDLLHLLFHDREESLQKTRWQQPALFVLEYAMARYLTVLGIRPVAMAGHSLGELTALCLAGVYSLEDGFGIVNKRALCMDKAAGMHRDPGVMAAVDVPLDLLDGMIRQEAEDVHISNINSPLQVVVSGKTAVVEKFCNKLKGMGYRATLLRVSMAFHSPIMRVIHDELEAYVAAIPFHSPRIPVISNTTMAAYPADPGEIRRILMAHLESPVHWQNNVETLWHDYGVRLFVEVGPGDTLSSLIMDTLPDPACIQTCLPAAESLTFKTAVAQLFGQGSLKVPGEPPFVALPALRKVGESQPVAQTPAARPVESGAVGASPVEAIIQREINRFMLETFGRFLKPDILAAIRRELHPTFQEGDLSSALTFMLGASEGALESRMQGSPGIPAVPSPGFISAIPATPAFPELEPEPAAAAQAEVSPHQELMERLIGIIMDATGFNRDEIQPDMDLRKDLSIRSSRLPVIMDAAERQFGIVIELEDFINVRTVQDIAQRIAKIVAGQDGAGLQPAATPGAGGPLRDGVMKPGGDEASLKRLVFSHVTVEQTASIPMEFSSGEAVLILTPARGDKRAQRVADILRRDFRLDPLPMPIMPGNPGAGDEGHDLRTAEGAAGVAAKIAGLKSLTGMVIVLPQNGAASLTGIEDVSRLLRGFFILLKTFLQTPGKKFVMLINSGENSETPLQLQAEGTLGLFLSAALEYPAVQFRTLTIDSDTDLGAAIRDGLNRGYTMVEMIHRAGKLFTSEGHIAPLSLNDSARLDLHPGDVVVISGGATGIGAYLARSLAPFKPRLVFLGRTSLRPGIKSGKTRAAHPPAESSAYENRALEITQTLAELHAAGIEASYHTCDVADPAAVRTVTGEVVKGYGKIRGIVHGAGVLRDSFLSQMTPDQFSLVTDIKFLGAWHLFQAVEKADLRFFVGLSSVAAIQGNPGQTNYAAGNRLMSAWLKTLRHKNGAIRFKALMLPPIEGAGMAEDPEMRELMQLKGVSYIHVNELAEVFCRELFVSSPDDDWVLFMRTLPIMKTARLNADTRPLPNGEAADTTQAFSPADFPMIERIASLNLHRQQLEALRTFSRDKDLWLEDHRPLPSVKHPLVSAAMFVETFMEAARLLYPYLQVRGVRQMRFLDMIQCPPGIPRPSRISCRRVGSGLSEVLCEASLATQEISPTGRLTDRFAPHCEGQVILDSGDDRDGERCLGEGFPDFPVRLDELTTGPMASKKILKWYKDRSGLAGRYRVLESLDGAGPGVVRGQTICRQTGDFADPADMAKAQYQYSPYLFEALLQLTGLYCVAMKMPEQRSMLPMEIGEMRFRRKCRVGERITLEARMRAQNEQGFSWDARGLDEQGRTIMQIAKMRMHWVSD